MMVTFKKLLRVTLKRHWPS